jgi:hypothetical protein
MAKAGINFENLWRRERGQLVKRVLVGWRRRKWGVLGLGVLAISVLLEAVIGTAAFAAFSNLPDPTWMTNGYVRAVIRSGDVIYIGGRFTSIRPCPTGTACPGVYAVNNVAAFDANTGAPIKTFRPAVTHPDGAIVYALAALDGKLFIGGKFATVDGSSRRNFAAVNAATGVLDANVTAEIGSDDTQYVKALLAVGTRVYVGGVFTLAAGLSRPRLAAFNSTGQIDVKWKPRADAAVSSLALACDGQSIFAGGKFHRAAGTAQVYQARETIARIDLVNGTLLNWQIPAGAIAHDLHAYDVAPTCDRLFVAYAGSNWAYALDLTDDTGDALWGMKTAGDVQTVAVYGNRVLLGGHFSQVDATDQNNIKRTRFAVVDFDGKIDAWAPSFDGRFFGPWDILVDGNRVWVGGDYTTVSGVAQRGIARFTDTSP